MKKNKIILYFFLIICFLLSPKLTFALVKANSILYEGKTLEIENFIYNDRTYVDLNEFCNSKNLNNENICKVEDTDDGFKKITINVKINENNYNYITYHKKGTKEFTSMIEIGEETIENDVNEKYFGQNNIDVESCPQDTCDNGKFYVPIRFLTQALGKTVEWDTENNTVKISDNLEDNFNSLYNIDLTENSYNVGDNINDGIDLKGNTYYLEQNKPYYMYVTNKENNAVIDGVKVFKYFKENNDFSIDGNKIIGNNKTTTNDIAMIIVHKVSDIGTNNNGGIFPVIINRKFSTEDNKKYTYISLGDSLAAGIDPNLNPGDGFSDYVATYLETNDKLNYYSKDFAVSGYQTSNLISDIENNVTKNINNESKTIQGMIAESDIITISIGANDFTHTLLGDENGNFSLGSLDNLSKLSKEELINTIDIIIPKVQETVKLVKKYNSNANIILLGFYNPIPMLYTINPQMIDEVFAYGNSEVDRITEEENIYSVHFYEEFKQNSDVYLPNALDIHPSEEGYRAMANKIIEVIDDIIS